MRSLPKFRQILGNPTYTRLTARAARRLCNKAREYVQHGTGWTHATCAVLDALIWKFAHRTSWVCMPSLSAIAAAAQVSGSTVKAALRKLEAAGLLKRHQRFAVWVIDGLSVRVRTSNAYTFAMDVEAVAGEGVGQKSATKQRAIDNSSLLSGLRRQAGVAIDFAQRMEQDARRSVERQLALLGMT